MSDLVEQLRDAAETFRAIKVYGGPVQRHRERTIYDGLADLIDGILGTYSEAYERYERYEVGAQSGADVMEVVLERLAKHVTAVLSGCTQTAREGR